jgi:hypothetical protein
MEQATQASDRGELDDAIAQFTRLLASDPKDAGSLGIAVQCPYLVVSLPNHKSTHYILYLLL